MENCFSMMKNLDIDPANIIDLELIVPILNLTIKN